jgi:hypothetical protein
MKVCVYFRAGAIAAAPRTDSGFVGGLKNWWRPARIAVPNGQILSGATIRIVNDCVMGG